MTKIVYLFPGQGSQNINMANNDLYSGYINDASKFLGYNLFEIISDKDKLNETQYTQPAIYVTSYASYVNNNVGQESFFIGHSLGEWSAVACAGCISFEEGLDAVSKRAEIMSKTKNGAMAAVLGVSINRIKEDINKINNLYIANYNLEQQTVISGSKESVHKYIEKAKNKNIRVIPLNVSGAFHSPFMEDAKENFRKSIESLVFKDAKYPIILNATAKAEIKGETIKERLINQLINPVYFYQSLGYALKNGAKSFYEVEPARVLINMVKRFNKNIKIFSIKDIDTLKNSNNNFNN